MFSKILLGTTNRKKIVEMRPLLAPLGYSLVDLSEVPPHDEVEETGSDFLENARLKATTYAQRYKLWTIGEDSGLCVEALDGAPGIYSARYAKIASSVDEKLAIDSLGQTQDQANNALLLSRLKQAPHDRIAHYVSTIVLSSPDGQSVIEACGECWGRIVDAPRGVGGFGYDPLFEVIEYHQTFAELGSMVKRAISHRSRALTRFLIKLKSINSHCAQAGRLGTSN